MPLRWEESCRTTGFTIFRRPKGSEVFGDGPGDGPCLFPPGVPAGRRTRFFGGDARINGGLALACQKTGSTAGLRRSPEDDFDLQERL